MAFMFDTSTMLSAVPCHTEIVGHHGASQRPEPNPTLNVVLYWSNHQQRTAQINAMETARVLPGDSIWTSPRFSSSSL